MFHTPAIVSQVLQVHAGVTTARADVVHARGARPSAHSTCCAGISRLSTQRAEPRLQARPQTERLHTAARREDPTIFGYNLMNEPRSQSELYIVRRQTTDGSRMYNISYNPGDDLQHWIEDMAGYVKSMDPIHLLSTGARSARRTLSSTTCVLLCLGLGVLGKWSLSKGTVRMKGRSASAQVGRARATVGCHHGNADICFHV